MNFETLRKIAIRQGYPKYFQGDLICNRCGEPWDSYGVRVGGDMTNEERNRFLRGGGCPCCTK